MKILKINLFFLLILLLAGCTKEKKESTTKSQKNNSLLQMQDSVTIDIYNDNFLYMKLKTTYLVKRKNPSQIFIKPVHIEILNKQGRVDSWIQADSGATNENYSKITLWSNVHAYTQKKEKVFTDSLIWNESINTIQTQSKIKIITKEGDVITGEGFIADKNLENWKILNNVHTQFQDIKSYQKK